MTVAICIETPTKFARPTVDEATAIPMGTIMKLEGENTVSASSADNDKFGGIAWEEFTGGEGLTNITVALNGKWDIETSAPVTTGVMVNISGANTINASVDGDYENGSTMGKLLESASTSEVVAVRVFE